MTSISVNQVIDNLPVHELRATSAKFVEPVVQLLHDKRMQRNVQLAAQGIRRRIGSAWAVAKRLYCLLGIPPH